MCVLRFPGRVLGENERPPDRLQSLVAAQLGICIVAWDMYAQRDETRREHLLELLSYLGMEQFGIKHYRAMSSWLESTALQTTQGVVLVQAPVDELRRRLVVLPLLMLLAVYQLKEYEADRRHATLVALMIETAATLTDEALDLHDRLIGSFFTKSKDKYEGTFAEQGKAINDKLRLFAKVGSALVAAREQDRDPFAAIEAVVSWENFSASVREAEQLARAAETGHLRGHLFCRVY